MCLGVGAPGGVKQITNQQGGVFSQAIDQAKQEFGAASGVFNDLVSAFAPIAAAGPSQLGWSPAELSTVNSASINNVAAQYKNAQTANKEAAAAYGGGTVALPSGVNIGRDLSVSNAAAAETAKELNQNLTSDFQQGEKNFEFATEGLQKAPQVFSTANQAVDVANTSGMDALKGQQVRSSYPTWSSLALGAIGDVASLGATALGGPAAGQAVQAGFGGLKDSNQSTGEEA